MVSMSTKENGRSGVDDGRWITLWRAVQLKYRKMDWNNKVINDWEQSSYFIISIDW
jgi:hypothetical protein